MKKLTPIQKKKHAAAYQRSYQKANREHLSEYNRAYYQANKEKISARKKLRNKQAKATK